MADQFLKLPQEQRRAILEGAESTIGIRSNLLEKDIWICWILDRLFTLPVRMAFKGGTSLSKCYNLIDRFSEDVDVTIDYRDLMPDLDIASETKNSLKNKRKELQERLGLYIGDVAMPMLEKEFNRQFDQDRFDIKFEDGGKLYFNYPSVFKTDSSGYVAESVLIEFGGTNKTEPNDSLLVKPYLMTNDLSFPNANVKVYSPNRTFWEKVTLIHVECHRGRLVKTPDRMSRHWYDLAKLAQSDVKEKALADKELLNDVLLIKKSFFNAGYANYDKCENKQFVLVPTQNEIKQLTADYTAMSKSAMFMSKPPPFDQIIDQLNKLQKEINQI